MVALRRFPGLTDDLASLASCLESLDLRAPAAQELSLERDRLASVIRSYLIPRIDNPDEPLMVVVAGPTGSGKSTLLNSLAGLDLSLTGPLRPTTTVPVLLTRASRHEAGMSVGRVECEVVVGEAPILDHMILVDTPDIDSTSVSHRSTAETLVDHADIVVFVTSAIRYADDVPWQVLRRAQSRGATVIPVLNRVDAASSAALGDFRSLLARAGIDADPIRVPEHHLGRDSHQVPSLAVRELRRRLYKVAGDRAGFHRGVINRVMNATTDQVRGLTARADGLAALFEETSARILSGVADAAAHPPMVREWAEPSLGRTSARIGSRRWMRRAQPTEADLTQWATRIGHALSGETETRLRKTIATLWAAVASPVTVSSIAADAGSLVEDAIDGWIEGVRARIGDRRHSRLSSMALLSATLTPMPDSEARFLIGPDHAALSIASGDDLDQRLGVVFAHHGERMVELMRLEWGEPSTDDLVGRVTAVSATYQFADA